MPPFRSTSTTKEDGVYFETFLQHLFSHRILVFVQGATTAEVEFSLELRSGLFFDDVKDFERFGDNFRSYVVARKDENLAAFGWDCAVCVCSVGGHVVV